MIKLPPGDQISNPATMKKTSTGPCPSRCAPRRVRAASRTSKKTDSKGAPVKIKGSMKVGDAEQLFDKHFGVTVQIKDKSGKKLVPNEITIGQASCEEY